MPEPEQLLTLRRPYNKGLSSLRGQHALWRAVLFGRGMLFPVMSLIRLSVILISNLAQFHDCWLGNEDWSRLRFIMRAPREIH